MHQREIEIERLVGRPSVDEGPAAPWRPLNLALWPTVPYGPVTTVLKFTFSAGRDVARTVT